MIKDKAPEARVEVLYNAVDVPAENPYTAGGRDLVMFLGRLGERKGTYVLLDAIRALDSRLAPGIRFCLCGDGDVERVREIVAQTGIAHRIAHVGWISGDEKSRMLSRTMMNVLPSFNEGLPMTILETMALGIPNISTPVASIPEVIEDGVTGMLVPPGDAVALASAIERMAGDARLRQRISDNSHALILKDFAIEGRADMLQKCWRRLCRAHR